MKANKVKANKDLLDPKGLKDLQDPKDPKANKVKANKDLLDPKGLKDLLDLKDPKEANQTNPLRSIQHQRTGRYTGQTSTRLRFSGPTLTAPKSKPSSPASAPTSRTH